MRNREVAKLLREIADILEMKDVEWKPRAYRRAANNIEALTEPVEEVYGRGELEDIDGVGEAIAEKVSEYLETGELEYYEKLKEGFPADIEALTAVEGVGPKTAGDLHEELGIETLEDLEEAAKKGEVAAIDGFGQKKQQRILDHIELAKKGRERMLLGEALPIAEKIREELGSSDEFEEIDVVGSFRRKRPTVGDIDILATADSREAAMDHFTRMDDVKDVLSTGDTKASVMISGDIRVDLRIVENESWGAALQYFTGSIDHNVKLRGLANERGWKLNEYGLFDVSETEEDSQKPDKIVAGDSEREVYSSLGLDYIVPELRENTGEIEAAEEGELPELIEEEDVRGDLQMHTKYSDGDADIRDMAEWADELGHDYILITDHSPALNVAQGPSSVEELGEQREEIDEANEKYNVEILHGMEVNVTEEGIDVSREMLEMLDLVVVATHGTQRNLTERLVDVFENYEVDIWAHPLNRKIHEREPLDLDVEKVISKASEENVALEINSHPRRLDLPWDLVKKYRDQVMYVVSTDAHSTVELDYMHLGVAQARRGWLEEEDVLNTRKLDELMEFFSG